LSRQFDGRGAENIHLTNIALKDRVVTILRDEAESIEEASASLMSERNRTTSCRNKFATFLLHTIVARSCPMR
jgi:hypothetical protein